MAQAFGADPQVAGDVSKELAGIRKDMHTVGGLFDGYRGATGSQRVEAALDDFHADSSDSRENMDKLLERASGLLRGLAEGTISVDTGLAGSLEPEDAERPSAAQQAQPVAGGGRP
jgi:hypothetical protein